MINKYIEEWLEVIENMNNDNTYKLAWGRAIIEICCLIDEPQETNIIDFNNIAHKMIKYYWNQTFFFNLKQSPNPIKRPVLVQNVEILIEKYKNITSSNIPVWFDKAEVILKTDNDFYQTVISKCARKLKDDVSWRFLNANKKEYELYVLDKDNLKITLSKEQVILIKEYSFILSQLLNYRWAQLLEKFNNAPRIASKVKGISDTTIKRQSLTKYKNILLENNNYQPIDFYTGLVLNENDISVDHVIPWSFMYSDDIWNLVLTSKSNNSQKSNNTPSQEIIDKLKKRNQQLYETITDSKYKQELEIAINNHYIDKFYMALKL